MSFISYGHILLEANNLEVYIWLLDWWAFLFCFLTIALCLKQEQKKGNKLNFLKQCKQRFGTDRD